MDNTGTGNDPTPRLRQLHLGHLAFDRRTLMTLGVHHLFHKCCYLYIPLVILEPTSGLLLDYQD